jgi:hypothetical protein
MRRLLFLSSISGLVATGCGDDSCGPGDAPKTGLLASSADVTLTYGNLTAGANNDCPDPDAPAGVVSLTIGGTQTDGTAIVTFCLPRPDQLAQMDLQLGTGLRIIDFNGEKDGCMFTIEGTRPVTGTVHATGLCDNGKDSAGFALGIDGNISLRRNCPTMTDTIAVTLEGKVAVAAQ